TALSGPSSPRTGRLSRHVPSGSDELVPKVEALRGLIADPPTDGSDGGMVAGQQPPAQQTLQKPAQETDQPGAG
ncbi:MAG: hypothetical protein AAFO79_05525, partial [Pseudomonadota bacterium]